jgi:hypothetical protein
VSLQDFARRSPAVRPVLAIIEEMAQAAREALGPERLGWLRGLARTCVSGPIALVHATPESCWTAPAPEAADIEMQSAYGPLGRPVVVYGHIHRPFVRAVSGMTVANSGSVGLPYDGDPRASYLLIEDGDPAIRRVEYDVEREIETLLDSRLPHAEWVGRMLRSGRPERP